MEKTILTTFYTNASEYDFDSFVHRAEQNFENRVVNIYNFAHEKLSENISSEHAGAIKFIKDSMYKTDFYKVFFEAGRIIPSYDNGFPATLSYPTYGFRVNTKNINFETTIHNVADRFNWGQVMRNVDPSSPWENPQLPSQLKEIPNWRDLFGKGEFPYFNIYAFRLGNTEYFAYEITK